MAKIWSLLLAVFCSSCIHQGHVVVASTLGTEFVFSLPSHQDRTDNGVYLFIESRSEPTTVHIETPYVGNSFNQSVPKGVAKIQLNTHLAENDADVSNNGVYLTSGTPISVHVIDYVDHSADGALLLPIFRGTSEYFTVSYTPNVGKTEITVTTLYGGTDVHIELKAASGMIHFNGHSYANGDTIHVSLNRLRNIQIQNSYDLTGTRITSNNPISVISGDSCVDINVGACDHIIDQVPPVSIWGSNFIITQLRTMLYVTFRIVAARDTTHVTVGLSGNYTLNRGEFLDKRMTQTSAILIQSDKPVLLVQFSEGKSGGHGDPCMAVIPSINHFTNGYLFQTPDKFSTHHVTVTIETALASGLRLNDQSVSRADEKQTDVNVNGQAISFSVIRFDVAMGTHNLSHTNQHVKFGALLYGFGEYVSYGYSLGYEFNVLDGNRLVYGNDSKSGILELNLGGTWTRACPGRIGLHEAAVICRSHGYYKYPLRQGAVQRVSSTHAQTSTRYVPTINCNGNEAALKQCDVSSNNRACATSDDVLIDCAPQMNEIVHVSCTVTDWSVDVDMDKLAYRYPGSVASDIYMGDNSCRGNLMGTHLEFNYDIQNCLTSQSTTNDDLIFSNELVYAYHDPAQPFIIRNYNWTLDITCLVLRNESTHSVVTYNQSTSVDATVNPVGGYHLKLKLFTDPNFLNAIPDGPIRVALGTSVYVKAFVENVDWTIKMKLQTCYTSTSGKSSSSVYFIIKDGCEIDTNTHIMSQAAHETRFVFSMFEMSSTNHGGLYLNCDAVFCDTSDPASLPPCQQPCGLAG